MEKIIKLLYNILKSGGYYGFRKNWEIYRGAS